MRVTGSVLALGLLGVLAGCATTDGGGSSGNASGPQCPACQACPPAPSAPVCPQVQLPPSPPVPPPAVTFEPSATSFGEIAGWAQADPVPALKAFRRTCAVWSARPDDQVLGASADWGGKTGDWRAACAGANAASDTPAGARAYFEATFTPWRITSRNGQNKLTGYYESVFQASRTPQGKLTEPVPSKPTDILRIDLSEFSRELNLTGDRAVTGSWLGQLQGDRVRPYPARKDITPALAPPLAYAHPVDVYDLMVQGSGRMVFADGSQVRAAFDGQNGRKWSSIYSTLRARGLLTAPELTKAGVRAWIDRSDPALVRDVMNTDPSMVFFRAEPITDPSVGPKGAQGVPLEGLGSMAIDPAFHPYGVPIWVEAVHLGAPFRRLLIAQDTGGAIRRGPVRGDVFFGTGDLALAAAEKMNHNDPVFIVFAPKGMVLPTN